MKHISIFVLTLLLVFGCKQNDNAVEQAKLESNSNTANNIKTNKLVNINAFVLDSHEETKSFEAGAKLAQINNTGAGFDLKFFPTQNGSQTSLNFMQAKQKSPVLLYWSVNDISSVAQKLSSIDAVGIVVGDVNKKIIPMGANVFGFGYSTELTFKQIAKYAGNVLKSYRFAVISADSAKFDLESKVFIEETKSLGNTIVFEEKIKDPNVDYIPFIKRAISENCDTIFVVLPASGLTKFIKEAKASNFTGKIIVGDTLSASDIARIGSDGEGVYLVQSWSEDSNLKSQYTAQFGNAPDGITLGYVALGYDTVKCLQDITSTYDAYTVKSSLLSTVCEGLTGKTQFTGERIAQRSKKILTIKNGELTLAK